MFAKPVPPRRNARPNNLPAFEQLCNELDEVLINFSQLINGQLSPGRRHWTRSANNCSALAAAGKTNRIENLLASLVSFELCNFNS